MDGKLDPFVDALTSYYQAENLRRPPDGDDDSNGAGPSTAQRRGLPLATLDTELRRAASAEGLILLGKA